MADQKTPEAQVSPEQADKDVRIAQLTKLFEESKKKVAELQAQIASAGIPDPLKEMVKAKMAAGLPQVDALESAKAQYEFDQTLAAEKAAKEKTPAPPTPVQKVNAKG